MQSSLRYETCQKSDQGLTQFFFFFSCEGWETTIIHLFQLQWLLQYKPGDFVIADISSVLLSITAVRSEISSCGWRIVDDWLEARSFTALISCFSTLAVRCDDCNVYAESPMAIPAMSKHTTTMPFITMLEKQYWCLVFFSPYFHIQQTYNNVLQPHCALRVVHRAFHRQHQLKPPFCYRSIANSFLQGCRARNVAFLYNPGDIYTCEDNRATSSLFLSSIKLQRHMKKNRLNSEQRNFRWLHCALILLRIVLYFDIVAQSSVHSFC